MLYHQFGNRQPIIDSYPSISKMDSNHILAEYTDDETGIITMINTATGACHRRNLKLIHSQDPKRKTDGKLIATAYTITKVFVAGRAVCKTCRLEGKEAGLGRPQKRDDRSLQQAVPHQQGRNFLSSGSCALSRQHAIMATIISTAPGTLLRHRS